MRYETSFLPFKISALMTQNQLQWMEKNEFTYTIICNWLTHGTWVFFMKTRAVWALKCVPFMPVLSKERFEGISLHLIKASLTYHENSCTIYSSKVFKSQVKGRHTFDIVICWYWEPVVKEIIVHKMVFLHNLNRTKCINSATTPMELSAPSEWWLCRSPLGNDLF